MSDDEQVVRRGPWPDPTQMGEQDFLTWLLSRLQAAPTEHRVVPLYDLAIDIIAPTGACAPVVVVTESSES